MNEYVYPVLAVFFYGFIILLFLSLFFPSANIFFHIGIQKNTNVSIMKQNTFAIYYLIVHLKSIIFTTKILELKINLASLKCTNLENYF